MSILAWALFGIAVGYIVNVMDPDAMEGGILGAMILGIVGALFGGFLAIMLFGVGVTGFNIESLVVAVAGALLVTYMGKAIRRY